MYLKIKKKKKGGGSQEVLNSLRKKEVAQSCPTICDPMDCSLQAPLTMGFFRQEYSSGLPFPSSGDLTDPGTESESPALAGRFFTAEPPGKLQALIVVL